MTSIDLRRKRHQLVLLSALFLLFAGFVAMPLWANSGNPQISGSTPPQRAPVQSTSAGKSTPVSVTLSENFKNYELRLYFKTMAAAGYLFLPMTSSGKGVFTASLPPAKNDTKGIDYLILLKNGQSEIRKTKPFRLLVLNDYAALPSAPGELEVFSEENTPEENNRDFAVPLHPVSTSESLLAQAIEDPVPPLILPEEESKNKLFSGFGDLGGISFAIKIGGVGFFYKGFSGH